MDTAVIQKKAQKVLGRSQVKDQVKKLALFGSHVHGTASKESDIDFLIEFTEPVGYFALSRMQIDLSKELGADVDLLTPDALSPYIADNILQDAVTIYER